MYTRIVLVLFIISAGLGRAAEPPPPRAATPPPRTQPARPPGNRFLFVVETSSAMFPFDHAGRQAVFDLIYSGVNNQIQPGDTLGIWNYGEQVHGGVFPMQFWETDQNLHLASTIGLFLKNQKYENEGKLGPLIPKLLGLVKAIKDVNILLVSPPHHVWKGTPFDAQLNDAFQKRASESLNAKQPFITALVGRNGALVSWAVVLPGEPIILPRVVPPARLATKTTPSSTGAVARANAPAPVKSIVISSKPPEADEPNGPGSLRITVKKESPAAAVPTQTNEVVAKAAEPSESDPSEDQSRPASSSRIGQKTWDVSALAPGEITVAAREISPSANDDNSSGPSSPLAVATPPPSFLDGRGSLVVAALLGGAAMGIVVLALRFFRRAPSPSFITRSLEREP